MHDCKLMPFDRKKEIEPEKKDQISFKTVCQCESLERSQISEERL